MLYIKRCDIVTISQRELSQRGCHICRHLKMMNIFLKNCDKQIYHIVTISQRNDDTRQRCHNVMDVEIFKLPDFEAKSQNQE